MIAISLPPTGLNWSIMSFASTLYLYPILDLLLAKIPREWQAELRLGLQEALVNASKHGNKLDPSKTVVVHFSITPDQYSWIITNEGQGFSTDCGCHNGHREHFPPEQAESGRGLYILDEIFDQVHWNRQGTQVRLCKQVKGSKRGQPLVC
ncbi:MAG: anti-sigma regulatory factor [Moorea sp. SIO2B7]|nr:anti-sigma regulatory factor [Moorena sp. SIO2B7]